MGKRKLITKKEQKTLAGCLTMVIMVFLYPIIWIWKGFVWLCALIWQYLKPLLIKLKNLVFSDYGNKNEQKTDAQ